MSLLETLNKLDTIFSKASVVNFEQTLAKLQHQINS